MEEGSCCGGLLEEGSWWDCWGEPAEWSCGGTFAFVSAFAQNPQCSAHSGRSEECLQFPGSRKALGNPGSRLEAQKKLATQGTQLTALVCKRQFQKGGGASGTGLMDAGDFSGKRCLKDPRVLGLGPMVSQRGLQRAHKRNFSRSMFR